MQRMEIFPCVELGENCGVIRQNSALGNVNLLKKHNTRCFPTKFHMEIGWKNVNLSAMFLE